MLHAHALPLIDGHRVAVHLLWTPPPTAGFALDKGFSVQRRKLSGKKPLDCDELGSDDLAELERQRVGQIRFGPVRLEDSFFTVPYAQWNPAADPRKVARPCHLVVLELEQPQAFVQVRVHGSRWFAIGLRAGRAVDAIDGRTAGGELHGAGMDEVRVYAIAPSKIQYCIRRPVDVAKSWSKVPVIASDLQIPVRELDSSLTSSVRELARARSRLLQGEPLSFQEFRRAMDMLRPWVSSELGRPVDRTLLSRGDEQEGFEHIGASQVASMLWLHPKWRRILGFAWVDDDPQLRPGEVYEYRVSGRFRVSDLDDDVYGFHSLPAGTRLPQRFRLRDLHVRLNRAARVELMPGTASSGMIQVTRKGLAIDRSGERLLFPQRDLGNADIELRLPFPVSTLVLDLLPGHQLGFVAGDAARPRRFSRTVPPTGRMTFDPPVDRIQIAGRGFLFGVRLRPPRANKVVRSAVVSPVSLVHTEPPPPPEELRVQSLQRRRAKPSLVGFGAGSGPAPEPRHDLGFEVAWRPAARSAFAVWPASEPAAPPLDAALFQIEHRLWRGVQPRAWKPVLEDENWQAGSRPAVRQPVTDGSVAGPAADSPERPALRPGADLMALYPEGADDAPPGQSHLVWSDVFDDAGSTGRRSPSPGSRHQYRIRTVDVLGRGSESWTQSPRRRLEKWLPPPLPASPDESRPDAGDPQPTGVQARVLVSGDPGLSTAERGRLQGRDSLILLRWGWHEQQRQQDALAREFRVYLAEEPLDQAAGEITDVDVLEDGRFRLRLRLGRALIPNAGRGSDLEQGTQTFHVLNHEGGERPAVTVEARVPRGRGRIRGLPVPKLGPMLWYLPLHPYMARPPAWTRRIHIEPIDARTSYELELPDLLLPTPESPRRSIWLGVSTADRQSYVPDQLEEGEMRPGNESGIVPVLCQARWHGRPTLNEPIPLEPVEPIFTGPPQGLPLAADLDLPDLLEGTSLRPSDAVLLERTSAAAVVAAYGVDAQGRIQARLLGSDAGPTPGGSRRVRFPNSGDERTAASALETVATTGSVDALEHHHLVFLAQSHPSADQLFQPVAEQPIPLEPYRDSLAPRSGRWVYRVRRADAAGRLSLGSAVIPRPVRVPSTAAPGAPVFDPQLGDDHFDLIVPPDRTISAVLAFFSPTGPGDSGSGNSSAGELLRVPAEPSDYLAGRGIRLRADSRLMQPRVIDLRQTSADAGDDGLRRVAVATSNLADGPIRTWAICLSLDGVPSRVGGPWTLRRNG